jgi:hypothetical protein
MPLIPVCYVHYRTYLIVSRMLAKTCQLWLSTGGSSGFHWLVCHLSYEGKTARNFGHQLFVLLLYHVEELV